MPTQNNWDDYAEIFLSDFDNSQENKELENSVGDKKLAAVIKFHLGSRYREWLHTNIPALGGKTPCECLASEDGIKQLRKMLMKIPY